MIQLPAVLLFVYLSVHLCVCPLLLAALSMPAGAAPTEDFVLHCTAVGQGRMEPNVPDNMQQCTTVAATYLA
jgi:hypothetical protein